MTRTRASDIHEAALGLLARRALSRRELGERLERKGFGAAAIRGELKRLGAAGLLDDGELARSVARSAVREGRGKRAIAAQLCRRRVARDATAAAIGELTEADLSEAIAAAMARAARRYPAFRRLPQERRKVIRYLLARGFAVAAVRRALESAAGEDQDEFELEMDEPGNPPELP